MANDPDFEASGKPELPRVLGPITALSVVIGSVIGSGIFLTPARIATNVPYIGGIAAVWIVGGLFSLAGALTLAELAAMLPSAGGPYVYLREAFGRLPAFLFGWAEFLVIRTGSIATLAAAFAMNFAQLVPSPSDQIDAKVWQTAIAVIATVLIAGINAIGTGLSGRVQVVGTALKIGALVSMMALPFFLGRVDPSNLSPVWPSTMNSGLFSGFMVAMISVLWTYDGWVNAAEMAEEIKDPGRNIPLALIVGLFALIAIYLGMTLVYHLVLPIGQVISPVDEKGNPGIVSGVFLGTMLGPNGRIAIALVIMASTFITLNGNALSGPRAYFAMARDGLFPEGLCRVSSRFQTPANAIVAQAAWAVTLMVAATAFLLIDPPSKGWPDPLLRAWGVLHKTPLYDILYTYVIFGGTIFYGLAIASVFVLRVKRPDLHRPYRTWGYPVVPLLYTLASLLLIGNTLYQNPFESIAGLLIVAAGLPAFWIFSTISKSKSKSA